MIRIFLTISILIFCIGKLSSQDLSLKVDFRTIYNAAYVSAADVYEIRSKTDRMPSFSLRYSIDDKSSLSFSYAKIVNYSNLHISDPSLPAVLLLSPNPVSVNFVDYQALSENGSDRLDSFTLSYSYLNLFNTDRTQINPTLGLELIHTEEELFFKSIYLGYGDIVNDFENARTSGILLIDGQYHQRITPFIKPGIEFGIYLFKGSPIHLTAAVNYRFPLLWDLNEVNMTRSLTLDDGSILDYRTTHLNTGRAFEVLFGAELSLKSLRKLF